MKNTEDKNKEELISEVENKINNKDWESALETLNYIHNHNFGKNEEYSAEEQSVVFSIKGICYSEIENNDEALEQFNLSLLLNPMYLPSLKGRAELNERKKDYSKALEDYNTIINKETPLKEYNESVNKWSELDKGHFYNKRGILKTHYPINDDKGAIEDLNKAEKLKEITDEGYYVRGSSKLNIGRINEDKNLLNEAIKDFDKAIEECEGKKTESSYHFKKALCYKELGAYKESWKSFEEAYILDKNCYAAKDGAKKMKSKHKDKEYKITQGIKMDKVLNKARIAKEEGKYYDAISCYQYYISKCNSDERSRICYLIGECKEKIGDNEEALKDYTTAIRHSKGKGEIKYYVKRGQLYAKTKDFNKGIEDLTKAIELNPSNAELYILRAEIKGLFIMTENDVTNDYEKAIELAPDHINAYIEKGRSHISLRQYELAIETLTKAINIDSNKSEAYSLRAKAYYNNDLLEKAKQDYNRAIYIKRDNPNLDCSGDHFMRGKIYLKLEDYDKALEDLNIAKQTITNNSRIYKYLGKIYEHKGDYEKERISKYLMDKYDPNRYWD